MQTQTARTSSAQAKAAISASRGSTASSGSKAGKGVGQRFENLLSEYLPLFKKHHIPGKPGR